MALPVCPVCHKRASAVGQQLYCPSCGWNREAGIVALRHSIRMVPVGIVLFSGFLLLSIMWMHLRNREQIAIMTAPIAFGLAFNYLYAKRRLAKLKGAPATALQGTLPDAGWSGQATDSPRPAIAASFPPDPRDQALLSVPRPRQIRMSGRGWLTIIVFGLAGLGFATAIAVRLHTVWARTLLFSDYQSSDWVIAALAVAIFLIPYFIWRMERLECDLLANGEVALAGSPGSSKVGESTRFATNSRIFWGRLTKRRATTPTESCSRVCLSPCFTTAINRLARSPTAPRCIKS